MNLEDFKTYDIRFFTPAEITGTGALLKDIRLPTIMMVNQYRKRMNRRVVLLPDGITTGEHSASEHPKGLAVDSAFVEQDGPVDVAVVFKAAISAGAKGIGLYWNGFAYSIHLDLRNDYAFWTAIKKHQEKSWKYKPLIIDPRQWEKE